MLYQIFFEQCSKITLIIRFDNGHIIEANNAAVEAYGYSRKELLILRIHELIDSESVQAIVSQMNEAMAGLSMFESVHRRKDGSTFFVEVESQCVTFEGVDYLINTICDITETKTLSSELLGRSIQSNGITTSVKVIDENQEKRDSIDRTSKNESKHISVSGGLKEVDSEQLEREKVGNKKKADFSILIVDDDPSIVDYISMRLSHEGFQVYTALYGNDALKVARNTKLDAVILDWMLPDVQGLEVCRCLRELIDPVIIMLSGKNKSVDKIKGLRAGADDYMVKPFDFAELLARIEAQLRRQLSIPGKEVLTYADITILPNRREVRRGHIRLALTPTEYDLLLLFMRNPGQVLSKEVILQRVWGYNFIGDINIVEVYIRYLRHKLDQPPLIHTVRGFGYIFELQIQ